MTTASVIIPARNEQAVIAPLVERVASMTRDGAAPEIVVVDDGSDDSTGARAAAAGARVIRLDGAGNPAVARNRGARAASGDALVFLDADCRPRPGWLDALLAPLDDHDAVGGAIGERPGASPSARADYLSGWYHVHERRPRGPVFQHPPCNIAVRRSTFFECGGYYERHPVAYAHEELAWQARLVGRGGRILFEPAAVVEHASRRGFGNLLRRSYRWGYSAIEAKSAVRITRWPGLYRRPWIATTVAPLVAPASTAYITACWLRAGRYEVVPLLPLIAGARIAYAAGMTVGGIRFMMRGEAGEAPRRPMWE